MPRLHLILAVVAATAIAAPAAAADPPPATPAVVQYVEVLPSSTGRAHHAAAKSAPLAPAAAQALRARGGSSTSLLTKIATDPQYGAVAAPVRPSKRPRSVRAASPKAAPATKRRIAVPVAAAASYEVAPGSSHALLWLGLAVGGVSVALVVAGRLGSRDRR